MRDASTFPSTTHCVVKATGTLVFAVGLPAAAGVVLVGGAVVVTESGVDVLVDDVAVVDWLVVVWLVVVWLVDATLVAVWLVLDDWLVVVALVVDWLVLVSLVVVADGDVVLVVVADESVVDVVVADEDVVEVVVCEFDGDDAGGGGVTEPVALGPAGVPVTEEESSYRSRKASPPQSSALSPSQTVLHELSDSCFIADSLNTSSQ